MLNNKSENNKGNLDENWEDYTTKYYNWEENGISVSEIQIILYIEIDNLFYNISIRS